MKRKAVILAAGKSNRFAPFTYEKPKGLFRVRNEVLIERQVEQMIEATTLNEAYQLRCEDRLGSITVGKEADLVVLAEDITTCDAGRIADTQVLSTMVGGEWVFNMKR